MRNVSLGRQALRGIATVLVVGASVLPPAVGMAGDPPASSEVARLRYAQDGVSRDYDWRSVERFLPNRTGDFILPYRTIAEQVSDGLGVAPLEARALPDGRRLLWGCRRHSCDEKSALVVSPDGKVEAVAMIHARCRFATEGDARLAARRRAIACDGSNLTLTMFFHVTQTRRPDLEQWAAAVIASDTSLARVEIYWV